MDVRTCPSFSHVQGGQGAVAAEDSTQSLGSEVSFDHCRDASRTRHCRSQHTEPRLGGARNISTLAWLSSWSLTTSDSSVSTVLAWQLPGGEQLVCGTPGLPWQGGGLGLLVAQAQGG